jgi:Zn-dependent protease
MDWISSFIVKLIVLAPPILMALTVHEVAHGLVAYKMGDPTAKMAGRLSLNPFKHLDLTGTLVFFVTAWLGAGIGWAKPVPVDYRNLRDPKRAVVWISAAGPAVNLLFAVLLAIVIKLLISIGLFAEYASWKDFLANILVIGVRINVVLAFFNMIPLPPLDGSGVLSGLLSPQAAAKYHSLSRYGFVILLALIILPGWLPGFPDLIGDFILQPANYLAAWLLPH